MIAEHLWEPALRRLGLRFVDPGLEAAFRRDYDRRTLTQVRLSIVLGSIVYLALGLQDLWFFPEHYARAWLLRASIVAFLMSAYVLTHRPLFERRSSAILAAVTIVAGLGPITMIAVGSSAVAVSYYLGLVLVVVWSYTFSGLRFVAAAICNLVLFAAYLSVSLTTSKMTEIWLLTNTTNLLAASLLVGFAAYLIERQRRVLFYHNVVLDAERRSHEQLAMSDHLTGLPNRSSFERRVEEAIQRARAESQRLALIFIDLNGFKLINDTYGHDAGDQVLVALGRRMTRSLRANDTVARIGGDEFVALLNDIGDRAAAERVVAKVRSALSDPVAILASDDNSAIVPVSASIGLAVYPDDGQDYLSLLRAADGAMYHNKRTALG